jgi:hypothetical protein
MVCEVKLLLCGYRSKNKRLKPGSARELDAVENPGFEFAINVNPVFTHLAGTKPRDHKVAPPDYSRNIVYRAAGYGA